MKRLTIAIAATFTAIAPAVFAQYDRPYDNRYDNRDNRYDNRDYRADRDFRGERARVRVRATGDAARRASSPAARRRRLRGPRCGRGMRRRRLHPPARRGRTVARALRVACRSPGGRRRSERPRARAAHAFASARRRAAR